jgi:cytosine permease
MATEPTTLPDYIAQAKPNPTTNRAPWYKNTAPTYAGIFLWFVFWDTIAKNGLPQGGLIMALTGVLLGAGICYFLFYLVPGLLGMKTGLPLYIVGTSTFGTIGGLLMPGFLMGLLQFCWLAVNTSWSSDKLANVILTKGSNEATTLFYVLCVVWALGAAFLGLKGIKYVARVATYLPLIPLAVLIFAVIAYGRSADRFHTVNETGGNIVPTYNASLNAALMMIGTIVGFFATAGAAGVDFGMNNRNQRDVSWGGLGGVFLATLFTAGFSTIAMAGALAPTPEGQEPILLPQHRQDFLNNPDTKVGVLTAMEDSTDPNTYRLIIIGLCLAAFPGACFSSFIAANSFKTVMPRVNSFLSVGLGAIVSIVLAVTHWADNLTGVFVIIGASFGPICGAMAAEYILSRGRWPGPRAGFNPAGWIAWLLGFLVGIAPNCKGQLPSLDPYLDMPAAPVAAFAVGFIVYFILAKVGLQSRVIPYAPAADQQTG